MVYFSSRTVATFDDDLSSRHAKGLGNSNNNLCSGLLAGYFDYQLAEILPAKQLL